VFVVACGTSYHAAMMAKYAIERWTRLPVEIDIASEFRYRDPVLDARSLVIGISQSGRPSTPWPPSATPRPRDRR
jgi:glutamine---fructose-6-phosphate transaminase (isomerizing)